MRYEQFVGPTYASWSRNVASERSVNLYPEIVEVSGEKTRVVFYGTPGITTFATLPTSPVRGLWAGEGRLFAAAGDHFYEILDDGTTITDRGVIGDDANHTPVDISPNGTQLMIVSAGNVYIDTGTEIIQPSYGLGYGTVDTRATSYVVHRVAGDPFDGTMDTHNIVIGTTTYVIDKVVNEDWMLVVGPIVDQVDTPYAVPQLSGAGNVAGTSFTQVIGETFNAGIGGGPIIINGEITRVTEYIDSTHITIEDNLGTLTGVTYAVPIAYGKVDTTTHYNKVYRIDGDPFLPSMTPGTKIIIFTPETDPADTGTTYTVWRFIDQDQIIVEEPLTDMSAQAYIIPTGDDGDLIPLEAGTRGTFLDGYFIVSQPNSKNFAFSHPWDGKQWDPLDQSVKEGYPDNIAAVFADHEELWIFGTHWSTEVWRNEGVETAPAGFVRDPGAFIHIGCVAPWSIASVAQGLYFLGGDTRGRVIAYRAQGFQPLRISTHAVEQVWSTYTTVWDAYAYSYEEEGHEFWVISFQTANATWVYDTASQMWHERTAASGTGKHKGRCHCYVFGKHFVGAYDSGKVYQMSHNILTEDGASITRQRVAPHIANEQLRVFHHSLAIDLEITSGAPSVTLDWSDDDTDTWSTPRTRAPSRPDKRRGRVVFNRLGSSRDRVYRVTISSPAKVAIVDALLNPPLTPGIS